MVPLTSLNRFQAAGIHLAISVVVAAAVLAALLLVWYPQPYFRLAGGAGLMMILIGVDVVIGPLLTLVVFNPAKKSLRLDLAVIAQARPAFVVFAGERFTVVAANAIDPESLASAKPPFDTLPMDGPRIVGARMPTDPAARERVMLLAAAGIDLPLLPRYYVPFADVVGDLRAKAQPIETLEARDAQAKIAVEAVMARAQRSRESLAWVPVVGRMEAGAAIVDISKGEVVAVLPISPF